ncbi:MAG: glutamate racemase [Candidatus Endonucleobacter bathymodioli]|uniref:Glutamate racemase n=1 Tax=Candidatus Endonucleibacter bathymodioli TaxID=539814 RepID=A0AA90NJU9_9GAMM|nr:glutamate racemase [Candidatus Endonucleobacter bathymodioli]
MVIYETLSDSYLMQEQARPIIIFDSGVGGLSIYKDVKQMTPELKVIYCADNKGFPYGPKPEEEVVDRTSYYLRKLTERYNPSLAIIACNTASTISLPRVRQELNIPVVGVVPAIKSASAHSKNRCFGLLATPGTITRKYTASLIEEFASDCNVISVGSSELVHMAEQYFCGEKIESALLKTIIDPFFSEEILPDSIVLGCTHFPLLKHLLQPVTPVQVQWIDSGEAIARRVKALLGEAELNSIHCEGNLFVYTGPLSYAKALLNTLGGMGFSDFVLL